MHGLHYYYYKKNIVSINLRAVAFYLEKAASDTLFFFTYYEYTKISDIK